MTNASFAFEGVSRPFFVTHVAPGAPGPSKIEWQLAFEGISRPFLVWFAAPSDAPAVTPDPGWTGGPGWNLFHHRPERLRKRDTLEETLRRIVFGADEDAEEATLAPVADEARVTVSQLVAAPELDPALLAALQQAEAIRSDLLYLRAVRDALDRQQLAEEDDMLAFLIMAGLA